MLLNWCIYVIFFISGIAGLVYEVVWTRQFGNLFGNTIHSAALVTGVFMGGLGVGSYLAGRWCDKKENLSIRRQLYAYTFLEIAIAILACGFALIAPHLEAISSQISSYQSAVVLTTPLAFEPSIISHIMRLLLATALISPITILMGATLPILIRVIVPGHLKSVGWYISLLYGFNTFGAACGAFFVDFSFIPNLGTSNTQFTAALLNLIAAGFAFLLSRKNSASQVAECSEAEHQPFVFSQTLLALSAGIGLAGFISMALQMTWFRFLIAILEATRSVFSLLLTVILLAFFFGTFLGGRIKKRPLLFLIVTQSALPVISLLLFYLFDASFMDVTKYRKLFVDFETSALASWIERWFLIRPILFLVAVPSVIAGMSFPLANCYIQKKFSTVGSNAGFLYFANTAGAILGSFLTGFYFLPRFGLQNTLAIIADIGLFTVLALYLSAEDRKSLRPVAIISAFAIFITLGLWPALPEDFFLAKIYRASNSGGGRYVRREEGLNQFVAVSEATDGKSSPPYRTLMTNGFLMSWTDPVAQRYMRGFSHIPLLQLENPEKVLVICFGVGNTVHAASLHPSVKSIEIADLSKEVLNLAREFSYWNENVLRDSRVQTYINDGRQHLRMNQEATYDLITLEPPPMSHAGVAALYSVEFYQLAKSKLKEGGFVTQWLPLGQAPAKETQAMIHAFIKVFPNMVLLSASRGHLIMMGQKSDRYTIDPKQVLAAIDSRPRVKEDLRKIFLSSPKEFFGMFINNGTHLMDSVKATPPLVDDKPVLEYWRIAFREITVPEGLFEPQYLAEWCPSCFAGGKPIPELKGIESYSQLVRRTIFGRAPGETPLRDLIKDPGPLGDAVRSSRYLQHMMGM